jgi:hypothetical protein
LDRPFKMRSGPPIAEFGVARTEGPSLFWRREPVLYPSRHEARPSSGDDENGAKSLLPHPTALRSLARFPSGAQRCESRVAPLSHRERDRPKGGGEAHHFNDLTSFSEQGYPSDGERSGRESQSASPPPPTAAALRSLAATLRVSRCSLRVSRCSPSP